MIVDKLDSAKISFHLALLEPEIPGNTGNIIRLSACLGVPLHLIHPLGYELSDAKLKRAGLDYHDLAHVQQHLSLDHFLEALSSHRIFCLTTKASNTHWDVAYQEGDVFLFGPETRGLPDSVLSKFSSTLLRIPMRPCTRSLNLSNAVAVVGYEAMRQLSLSTMLDMK